VELRTLIVIIVPILADDGRVAAVALRAHRENGMAVDAAGLLMRLFRHIQFKQIIYYPTKANPSLTCPLVKAS